MARRRSRFSLLSLALCALPGCAVVGGDDGPSRSGEVAFTLHPLVEGSPVVRATFDLRIDTIDADGRATPHLAIHDLETAAGGAGTYIGTCQSGPDGTPGLGVATATLTGITLADGSALFGAQLPMTQVRPFLCRQGGDTPIDFTFEVVLQLDRGFTDVKVDIEAMQCAAKFDCVEDLLANADGVHAPTFITGLTCEGHATTPRDNLLSFTRRIRCYDADGNVEPATVSPRLSSARTYTGFLRRPGADDSGAAYWNTATVLDSAAFAGADHCRFEGFAFVRSQPVGTPRAGRAGVGGAAIRWDVEARIEDGKLVCDGTVGPTPVGLRIDDAASPEDSTIAPAVTAVSQTTTAIVAGVLDPDCGASAGPLRDAIDALDRARDAISAWESATAIELALAPAVQRFGDPFAASGQTLIGALVLARALNSIPGFDLAAVVSRLDSAELAVTDGLAFLRDAPRDDATIAAIVGLATELVTDVSSLRAAAVAGDYNASPYDDAQEKARELATMAIDRLAAARATLAESARLEPLHAALADAAEDVETARDAYEACRAVERAPSAALRVWGARDVRFPLDPDAQTGGPAQDDLLWVAAPDGSPYEVTFDSACMTGEGRALIVVQLRHTTLDSAGRRAALQVSRDEDGDWVCASLPDGSCEALDLALVTCIEGAP